MATNLEKLQEEIVELTGALNLPLWSRKNVLDAVTQVSNVEVFTKDELVVLNGAGLQAGAILLDEEGNLPEGLSGEEAVQKVLAKLKKAVVAK